MKKRSEYRAAMALVLCLSLLLACTDRTERESPVKEEQVVVTPTTGASALVSPTVPEPTVPPPTPDPTPTPTPPPLAAVVNGQYILLEDYERRVALIESALLDQGLDPESGEGQSELSQMRRDTLERLIEYSLIEQGAQELGILLTEEELEAQMEAEALAGGGWEAFEEWLAETGLTRGDYQSMLRESLLAQRVVALLAADIPQATEQVHLRHIVVDSEEAAEALILLLEQGADFAELAQEESLDLATREEGGDLGWLPRGVLEPELERVAFALPVGEVSDAILSGGEYQLLQVLDRQPDRALSPETRVDLELAAFEQWLEGLRRSAQIERFVGE
jgi:parvulin-like peptidyl-prolyl isomerase